MRLEHVGLNQERFRTPGLRADSRGVAIGEGALIRTSTLTQVVGFFRALSEETSLDHILPTTRIVKARNELNSLEFLVIFASQGSHMMDRAAAIARLLGAQVFTGRSPHYVLYRDSASPYGYDVQRITSAREGIVLYEHSGDGRFRASHDA